MIFLAFQFGDATYSVTDQGACRRQFLKPVTGLSLADCIGLHLSNSTNPVGELSYDTTQGACYAVIPMLPSDYSCPEDDDRVQIWSNSEPQSPLLVSPTKITMTGKKSSITILGPVNCVSNNTPPCPQ